MAEETTSPTGDEQASDSQDVSNESSFGNFPICPVCRKPVSLIRHLDYQPLYRVVMHTDCNGILGILDCPTEQV